MQTPIYLFSFCLFKFISSFYEISSRLTLACGSGSSPKRRVLLVVNKASDENGRGRGRTFDEITFKNKCNLIKPRSHGLVFPWEEKRLGTKLSLIVRSSPKRVLSQLFS